MSMRSGLFDSKTIVQTVDGYPQGDRAEMADFFAKYFAAFISNGVYPNPSTNFQVLAYDQMTIEIQPGLGFINGYFCWDTEKVRLTLNTANVSRTYRIILRLSLRTRLITLELLSNSLTLTRNDTVWEIALADVKVKANQIIITQNDIFDLRLNKSLCGIVHGIVDQVDTTTLGNQLQNWIDAYMQKTEKRFKEFSVFLSAQEKHASDNLVILLNYYNARQADSDTGYANLMKYFAQLESKSNEDYQNLLAYFEMLKVKSDEHYQSYFDYILALKVLSEEEYLKFTAWLETYKQQSQDDFETWFNTIKGILGTDEAGNLLLLIQDLQSQQPTKYIATLEHNTNSYPHVDVYSYEHGYGASGFGNGGYGGSGLTTVPAKLSHLNKNVVEIYSLPEFSGINEITRYEDYITIVFPGKAKNLLLILR